jgi:chromatin segregation and condensation protein Rec8/ScpA/Scc1 (kleisin family)
MQSLRAIQFHQLCAIAKAELLAEPTMDDSEWKARTKDRLTRQGYDYPEPTMLSRVLAAVEAATRQTVVRSVILPSKPEPTQLQQADPPWRGTKPAGWAVVEALLASHQ